MDVLQGFLRQKIMPPDILNLRWTGWFLVILMVIPGSIKRAGQLPIKAKGWIFLRPKICCGRADKNNFLESNKFQLNPVKVVWQGRRVDIEKHFWSQKKKTIETFSMIAFLKTDWNRLVLFIARNKKEGMRSLDFSWFESNFLRNRGVFWRVRVILSLRYRQPAAMHITWTTMHTRLTPWQQWVCMLGVGLVLRGSRSTSRGSTSTSREHWQRSWHPFSLASSQSCSLGHYCLAGGCAVSCRTCKAKSLPQATTELASNPCVLIPSSPLSLSLS